MKFNEFNIGNKLLKAIEEVGYTTPTLIQEKAIPVILSGKDVVGCAQTGTGKTAAFAIPILEILMQKPSVKQRKIKTLILTPTRELALQIFENFELYGKYTGLRSAVIFGGVSQKSQVDKLKKGIDVLIATPGRLNDLHNQGFVDLRFIEIFVLDEADRMLDMGFVHDVKKVISLLPANRQTLLFSATMPKEIQKLAQSILIYPEHIEAAVVSSTAKTVSQVLYKVDKSKKTKLLIHLLNEHDLHQVLVFTRTKHGANRLVKALMKENIQASAIHGDRSQSARQKALNEFKANQLRVLVATDIAARGIDIDRLPYVINFDLPNIAETYVHRIGRTGRAGQEGKSISFANFDELAYLKDIEKLIQQQIPVEENHPYPMENFALTEKIQPQKSGQKKTSKKADKKISTPIKKTDQKKQGKKIDKKIHPLYKKEDTKKKRNEKSKKRRQF